MRCPRFLPLVALVALTLPATPAGAKTPRLTLQLPSAGHMTVAALRVDVTTQRPERLPRRVSLGARKLGALPSSVKVLFATRSKRIRDGRRYMGVLFIVRRAEASTAARAAGAPHEPNIVELIFGGDGGSWSVCSGCGAERPSGFLAEGELCSACDAARFESQLAAVKDADKRKPRKLSALAELFRTDWAKHGEAKDVFDRHPPDPTLETGHYDDGHSFGWGTPQRPTLPPPDVLDVQIDLVEDLIERQPAQLVPDLEVAAAIDLNGDGAIGVRPRIDTRVGPPVIS
ncbi:MAG TPA: hypothetical protein VFS37_15825 [Conexibacter sp.]|nr:hypothetical protein [Conexibacter sp.]